MGTVQVDAAVDAAVDGDTAFPGDNIFVGQLGVVWVILSLFWVRSELKRAGGRAASLSSRPPAAKGSLYLRTLFPFGPFDTVEIMASRNRNRFARY